MKQWIIIFQLYCICTWWGRSIALVSSLLLTNNNVIFKLWKIWKEIEIGKKIKEIKDWRNKAYLDHFPTHTMAEPYWNCERIPSKKLNWGQKTRQILGFWKFGKFLSLMCHTNSDPTTDIKLYQTSGLNAFTCLVIYQEWTTTKYINLYKNCRLCAWNGFHVYACMWPGHYI